MASVFKPTGRLIYRIKFKDQHGQEHTISSDMIDKRAAEGLAHMIEQDVDRIRAGMLPAHPLITGKFLGLSQAERLRSSLLQMVDEYLADLDRRRKRAATRRHRNYKIKRVIRECHWECLADVTAESFTRYLTRLSQDKRAASTCNAYRDSLNAFLEWCVDQGWLEKNPIGRVRRSEANSDHPHRRRAFAPEELRALLAAAPRHRDRYLVAALTGLRGKELSLMEKRDFDLAAGVWTCRPEVDKGGRPWRLPILPDLLPELARILIALPEPTSRPFPQRIGNCMFDDHLKKAKLPKIGPDGRRLNFHPLRYFFCTMLAKRMPIQNVQRLMRHSDIRRTVNLYLDLGLDDLAQTVAKLPSMFEPAPVGTAGGTIPPAWERKAQ
jgi:integrase